MHVVAQIALVSFGSALGGLTRWGVATVCARWFGTAFPWGTFLINITGSLFLGWFATMLTHRLANGWGWLSREDLQLLVALGFTGAYTTFSTFELETYKLLHGGAFWLSAAYIAGSVFLGLIAVRVGILLAGAE